MNKNYYVSVCCQVNLEIPIKARSPTDALKIASEMDFNDLYNSCSHLDEYGDVRKICRYVYDADGNEYDVANKEKATYE